MKRKVTLESLEGRTLMAGGLTVAGPYNASRVAGSQSEVDVAVNPTNPANVVVVANNNDAAGFFYGVSFDSGQTFTGRNLGDGTGGLTSACCDAHAAFDQFGNLFIVYLDGSITSAPILMSTDGGKNLTEVFKINNVSDQPKLQTGPGGSVAPGSLWVEYLENSGRIGGVGLPVRGLGQLDTANATAVSLVPGSDGGNFGKLGIGPNGQVFMTYQNPSGGVGPSALFTSLDPDGLGPQGFGAAVKLTDVNVGGFAPIPAQPARTVDSEVEAAYDFSGGPNNGRLYVVFTDSPAVGSADTNIFVMTSNNDGASWGPRVRVNDDVGSSSQFMPRIAIDQTTGNVGVSFYDARNDTGSGTNDTDGKANTDAGYFVTVSLDGGSSFVANVQVSNGPSNSSAAGGDNNHGNDYGDYTGLDFTNNVLFPGWVDNSSALGNNPDRPNLDIAVAQVTVESLTVTPVKFNAVEGTPFSGVVATFKPATSGIPASSFTATINWGDGVITAGQTSLSNGVYRVTGQHTYPEGGSYPFVVNLVQLGGSTASGSSTATIAGLPLNASGVSLSLKEGDSFAGVLAHFVDTSPIPQSAGHYAATINFGDGTNGAGTIIANPAGGFDVFDQSGHIYGGGSYNVTITITDPGTVANPAIAITTANVTDSPITAVGLSFAPVEGLAFPGAVATFTDADPRVPPISNYFATIDYGDGTFGNGVIQANPTGPGFIVVGDHPYSVGSYTVVVTVGNFSGGSNSVALSTATVADAPLFAEGFNFSPTAGVSFKGILATLTDADPRDNPVEHYQATIFWGDGTREPGTIVKNIDGGYLVKGSHAYRAGIYTITTTITDVGGSTVDATGIASVADAPVTLTLDPRYVPGEGTPPSNFPYVANFTTPNLLAVATDFKATVSYGDGTTEDSEIFASPQPGTFFVGTSKIYDKAGTYPLGVVLTSPGGSQIQTTGSVTVTAAPITATPVTIVGQSKTLLTGVTVATFTSANPKALASAYSATISWGDGTSSAGTVAATGLGGFAVLGDHTYNSGGGFSVLVTITGSGVNGLAVSAATIADKLFPISGGAAASPGGSISDTGLTNSATPIFTGTAEAFATVSIYQTPSGGSTPVLVGSGKADSLGNYSITGTGMTDGQYTITASATDRTGNPSSPATVLYPTASRGLLTVDTQGPKVTQARLDPRTGKVTIALTDALSGLGSGVLQASSYALRSPKGKLFPVTGLTVTPVSPNTQQTVTLTFATAKPLTRGQYVLTVLANGASDRAGNSLDERYFVPFPGLYTQPGQNFVAAFNTDGRTISQAIQFIPPREIVAARNHGLFVRKHFRKR